MFRVRERRALEAKDGKQVRFQVQNLVSALSGSTAGRDGGQEPIPWVSREEWINGYYP